jgi:hypothetical protein
MPQSTRGRRTLQGHIVFEESLVFAYPASQLFTPASGIVLEFYQDEGEAQAPFAVGDAAALLGRVQVKLDPNRISGKQSEYVSMWLSLLRSDSAFYPHCVSDARTPL